MVLGGGRTAGAEYHEVSLNPLSMERLRYGVWLSRETGFPLAFSGGVGPGFIGPSEGSIALRIARDEFRHPLRWMEDRSRDTHENALRTIEMLRDQGDTVSADERAAVDGLIEDIRAGRVDDLP